LYVFHHYDTNLHDATATSWQRNAHDAATIATSYLRLNTLLDNPTNDTYNILTLQLQQSRYGLGDRRTLHQLEQFSGIDLKRKRQNTDGINRCGTIQWVPFQQHPMGVDYIPSFDPSTEMPIDVLGNDPTSIWHLYQKDPNNENPSVESQSTVLDVRQSLQESTNVIHSNRILSNDTTATEENMVHDENQTNKEQMVYEADNVVVDSNIAKDLTKKFKPLHKTRKKRHKRTKDNDEEETMEKESAISNTSLANAETKNDPTKEAFVRVNNTKKEIPTYTHPLSSKGHDRHIRGGANSFPSHHGDGQTHSLHRNEQQHHGIAYLPLPVQLSTIFLVVSVFVVIVLTSRSKQELYRTQVNKFARKKR